MIKNLCEKFCLVIYLLTQALNHDLPFEFVLLLDLKEQKIISKFSKNLVPTHSYKLLSAEKLFKDNVTIIADNINYQKQIENLQQKVKQLEKDNSEQQIKIKDLSAQCERQLVDSQSEFSKKIDESQKQQQKLESENKDLRQEKEQYIKRIQTQSEQITEQEKKMKELTQQCNEFHINYNNVDKERNQLKIDLANCKNDLSLKISENKIYEDEQKASRMEINLQKKLIDEQKWKLESHEMELKKREEKLEKQSAQIEEKDKKIYSYMDNFMQFSERLSIMVKPQQEETAESKKVDELRKQIQDLQQNLIDYQRTCQELTQKNQEQEKEINLHYEEMTQVKEKIKKESEDKILQLKTQAEDFQKKCEKLQLACDHIQKINQEYLEAINKLDARVVEQEKIIIGQQNSKDNLSFRTRLQKLVELSDRPYVSEIDFAIEQIYRKNTLTKLENYQMEEVEYKVYQFSTLKETIKENENAIKQVILQEKEIDLFNNTLYELNDLDFSSRISAQKMEKIIKGRVTVRPETSNENSYDKIFIFQSNGDEKNLMKNSYFAVRQISSYKFNEIETKETAINESVGLMIAQNMLDRFNQELKNQNPALKELKFSKPYMFSKQQSFKQFLIEVNDDEKMRNFLQVRNLIFMLNDEESNQFYDDWRAIQLEKDKIKYQKNIDQGFLFLFHICIKGCNAHQREINDKVKQLGEEIIKQEFQLFTQFLDDIHVSRFPVKKYYSAYEIHPKKEGDIFMKYNGGHLPFDKSEVGKFLSAFSYYSIQKSHRQICVSHLQGIGNYLYDPLISSYDGILNKLDQGINEIRTFESKFETAKPEDIGEQYLNLLGIQRKQDQQPKIEQKQIEQPKID